VKPHQVYLFDEEGGKFPEIFPAEPVFFYGNKRYRNFLSFDCLDLKNSEYLKEIATTNIESRGILSADGRVKIMEDLQKTMGELKKIESLLVFPDEVTALVSLFSIFYPQTTFFVDYEATPSVIATLQYRSVEYYTHKDLTQLDKLLSVKSEKVIIIDGLYEWIGNICPVSKIIDIAKDNDCFIVANEINSFGLLGRDGRGFIDLFNIYDEANIEIGSFNKFLGGFGCYLGAKKYLINKIQENITDSMNAIPQFMLAVNLGGLELIKRNIDNKSLFQQLWKKSRFFISRIKQIGLKTLSETPIITVSLNNEDEAERFRKGLFGEQIIVAQNKERLRLCLSVEHSKEDLNYCLDRFELIGKELGLIRST
jgi:glycine C-acetyltransferase